MIFLYASFFNTNFADCSMLEVLDSTDRFSCVLMFWVCGCLSPGNLGNLGEYILSLQWADFSFLTRFCALPVWMRNAHKPSDGCSHWIWSTNMFGTGHVWYLVCWIAATFEACWSLIPWFPIGLYMSSGNCLHCDLFIFFNMAVLKLTYCNMPGIQMYMQCLRNILVVFAW